MCGRFSQGEPSHRIADYFGATADEELPSGLFNVPPTELIRIVAQADDGRRLTAARWGFRPLWLERHDGRAWINARAETASSSRAFGPALRSRRCVVPADAFYEWDRTTTPRQPYAIGPAYPDAMLPLGGIWSPGAPGEPPTAAILTTSPNDLVRPVHDRMPVILPMELVDAWLDPDAELADVEPMLTPADDASLRIWPVSTAVNAVASDGPHLLAPVATTPSLGLL